MEFIIVDTLSAYQRLLDAPDAATREAVFVNELIAPFQGLVKVFGGDGLATFSHWNMSPDSFADANKPRMQALVDSLRQADAQNRAVQALHTGLAAFEQHIQPISLESIIFGLYIADLSATPWNRGYSGFGGIPGWVMTLYGEATDYNLARVEAATAHELHHNIIGAWIRLHNPAAADWNTAIMTTTVGEYLVSEGLAESFATELYGEECAGPWVTGLTQDDVTRLHPVFREAIHLTGFSNIQQYLYGDAELGIPPTAGYALGYRMVQAYLKRSGKSVVEASLVPAQQIVIESGYFA